MLGKQNYAVRPARNRRFLFKIALKQVSLFDNSASLFQNSVK